MTNEELITELECKTRQLKESHAYIAGLSVSLGAMTVGWGLSVYAACKAQRLAQQAIKANHVIYDRAQYIITTLQQKGVDVESYIDEFDLIALRNMAPEE